MREAEIQSLVPLVSRRGEVCESLILRHGTPYAVSLAIASDVVGLDEKVESDVGAGNDEEPSIATLVTGRVVYMTMSACVTVKLDGQNGGLPSRYMFEAMMPLPWTNML